MHFKEISFPVFKLEERQPSIEGGVAFYAKELKDGKVEVKVIDDINIPYDTFSKRRIKLMMDTLEGKIKLQKINMAIYFLGDLVKISTPNLWFIDSAGKIFKYTKSKTVPLIYRKIINTIRIVGGVLIEVEGIPHRFKCLFAPLDTHKYASILKIAPYTYLLYGFANSKYQDTVRRI